MNYFGECCYGDGELFEKVMNPFYRSQKQVSIVKEREESPGKKNNIKEKVQMEFIKVR